MAHCRRQEQIFVFQENDIKPERTRIHTDVLPQILSRKGQMKWINKTFRCFIRLKKMNQGAESYLVQRNPVHNEVICPVQLIRTRRQLAFNKHGQFRQFKGSAKAKTCMEKFAQYLASVYVYIRQLQCSQKPYRPKLAGHLECSSGPSTMISWKTIYHVLEETVPLYVAMILAYLSIKWWKLFTPEQCSGINKFVAKFSIPLLSFQVLSTNNPYDMNLKLILSDVIQKSLALLGFAVISRAFCMEKFDRLITGFSLSTLPNTLIIGIPLLKGMYGAEAVKLISQIVALQSLIWYTLLLFLFEFRAARGMATTTSSETTESGTPGPTQQTYEEDQAKGVSARCYRAFSFCLVVGRKLVTNPNMYASLIGLIWALISFRWRIQLPLIVSNSIRILSDGGLGMAMFSLGLFTALQTKIIACGTKKMLLSLGIRFFLGPALMVISSYAVGMRGTLLKIAIMQAALPQGIVPFVFAKEYNVHADILSTAIIIGMMVAVPVALGYYFVIDHSIL
ncbi:hypothetical protein EJB05_17202 [Eragrostis curvula]|uniref:Auxin efflux carrier component n=1 Tax=Eragrostis curvula TaxID=38414 RepID=A0A5J9VIH4_9POAL|nr:hypothetical protein EJB05_17202 [Eragrostis curvula]